MEDSFAFFSDGVYNDLGVDRFEIFEVRRELERGTGIVKEFL
jgi:hypothetical protein